MIRGIIIRFGIDTNNPYFSERFDEPLFHKKCNAPKNLAPHWCICEPRIRKSIQKGDRLFFVQKGTYLVKGVLTVKCNASEQQAKDFFGREWFSFHRKQVCKHKGVPRHGNIIIGDSGKSFYWTKGEISLNAFRDFLPDVVFDSKRQRNSIPKFTQKTQVEKLYKALEKSRPKPLRS